MFEVAGDSGARDEISGVVEEDKDKDGDSDVLPHQETPTATDEL
jgi:hypothetical protein